MKVSTLKTQQHTTLLYIGQPLSNASSLLHQHLKSDQCLIVSDATVSALYIDALLSATLPSKAQVLLLPAGESGKTLENASIIWDYLAAQQYRRNATLIALGGGAISDVTGFAAHCYHRGMPYINIPTTLLAQVDAAIGGKVGVNHALGKNKIGAFHHPACVIIDTHTLATLPKRQYHAGLAEVIKHALIADTKHLTWLEHYMPAIITKEPDTLITMIAHTCTLKARMVEQDEEETHGLRQLLNFGHTFAHAIETLTQYKDYLHGEAVAIGMVMAAELSHVLGYIHHDDVARIITLLHAAGLPTRLHHALSVNTILHNMHSDKKKETDALACVVLKKLGQAQFNPAVPEQAVRTMLENKLGLSP